MNLNILKALKMTFTLIIILGFILCSIHEKNYKHGKVYDIKLITNSYLPDWRKKHDFKKNMQFLSQKVEVLF